MTTNGKINIPDQAKIADLTVGEFKTLIHGVIQDVVQQAVFELEQQLPDPDEGKAFKPEFAAQLEQALDEAGELYPLEVVKRELGIDD